MNTNLQGNIGEAKALQYFIKEGYEVYLPFGTASKYDMIVVKDNLAYRVSVKTTSRKAPSGKYLLKIEQGKLKSMKPFDKDSIDFLFAYVLPEDRYILLNAKSITKTRSITI